MPVLVENAAEAIAAAYVEAGDLVRNSDRRGQWIQRAGIRDVLMRPMGVAELSERAQGVAQMPLIPDQRAVQQLAPSGLVEGATVTPDTSSSPWRRG